MAVGRTRRTVAAIGVGVLALSGVAAACGDDDAATTTTIESSGSGSGGAASETPDTADLAACADLYAAGTTAEGPEAIEGRGAPTMQACRGDGTLQVIDEVVGTGPEAAAGATVDAHYTGVVAADGQEFDSSWSRGESVQFSLDQVIPGWSEGLVGMKAGGRRTLVIPAEMAYGSSPPQGSGIPANADLVFTVDLVGVS